MNIYELTIDQLKRAAAIKEQIEGLNRELRAILGGSANSGAVGRVKTRTMSAAVKRKIAAAQKARWASLRRAKTATRSSGGSGAKAKKKSPATRAKLSAKMKAYWAARKAGKEARAGKKEEASKK